MLEIRKLESDMIILLIIPSKKFQGKENHFIILTLVRANDVETSKIYITSNDETIYICFIVIFVFKYKIFNTMCSYH